MKIRKRYSPSRLRTSKRGLELIASFEGFRSKPYRDAVGIWTIGFGHTHAVGPNTKPITRVEGLRLLAQDVRAAEDAVRRLVRVKLSQGEFDALVSFTYNVGAGALASSTLLRRLNGGHRILAGREFLKWDKAGGRVLEGLARRRRAERHVFRTR